MPREEVVWSWPEHRGLGREMGFQNPHNEQPTCRAESWAGLGPGLPGLLPSASSTKVPPPDAQLNFPRSTASK